MNRVSHMTVNLMRQAIIKRYGPTIRNELVMYMSAGRIVRIYMAMNKLGPKDPEQIKKRKTKRDHINGQISLFEELAV